MREKQVQAFAFDLFLK